MRSFGVEEELLLVEEQTGQAVPVARALLRRLESSVDTTSGELTAELQQEMVEAVTEPHESLDELLTDVIEGRAHADRAAQAVGARAVAVAISPLLVHPHIMADSRYALIRERFGVTARNSLTCGLHVHVTIDGPEEGVAVLDRIRSWLPLLTAISANSPFAGGQDTGFASYRSRAWSQWPTTGPNDLFGTADAYAAYCDSLLATGVLLDAGMFYFDARLSRNHPTIEIRVSDVCLEPSTTVAVAAICRALVDTAVRDWHAGEPAPPVPSALIRLASLRAAQTALEEQLLHPIDGVPVTSRVAIDLLLAHIGEALIASGDATVVPRELNRLLAEGTGSAHQRASFTRSGNLRDVVTDAIALTHGVQ
ncbi:carboxylate-amine ligase [Lacisediminihabitans changchengi]|uniref:Putative glutamate--cysteine ligase 2 n=1 Tax=Lacisediminihabitans changchengi TaxID=2787634 RepID=A0A934VX52_9MICO|nr:glutamate--cysteine ligase [Lacisediminihabitans changchengi]MBK4346532.1 glutamate--cysteine ligase [Lacisediminihabitans changchengi]